MSDLKVKKETYEDYISSRRKGDKKYVRNGYFQTRIGVPTFIGNEGVFVELTSGNDSERVIVNWTYRSEIEQDKIPVVVYSVTNKRDYIPNEYGVVFINNWLIDIECKRIGTKKESTDIAIKATLYKQE